MRKAATAGRISDGSGTLEDPGMPFLCQALDPACVQKRLVKSGVLPASTVEVVGIRICRHKPGRRCLIRYDLRLETAEPCSRTLMAKLRAKGPDHATFQLLRQLWCGPFGPASADGIYVPEPLGMIEDWNMSLLEWAPGASAAGRLTGKDGLNVATRLAAAAHKLHASKVELSRRHTLADELRILSVALRQVVQLRPRLGSRVERVLEGCQAAAGAVHSSPPKPIHRDFYPEQVLEQDGQLWLLDFDLCALGDPAVDIGNMAAHLMEQALRTGGDPAALSAQMETFLAAYSDLAPAISSQAIKTYITLTLARHVSISTRMPERRQLTPALLELTEQRLGIPRERGHAKQSKSREQTAPATSFCRRRAGFRS